MRRLPVQIVCFSNIHREYNTNNWRLNSWPRVWPRSCCDVSTCTARKHALSVYSMTSFNHSCLFFCVLELRSSLLRIVYCVHDDGYSSIKIPTSLLNKQTERSERLSMFTDQRRYFMLYHNIYFSPRSGVWRITQEIILSVNTYLVIPLFLGIDKGIIIDRIISL